MGDKSETAGMILIGIGIGKYIPNLPVPLDVVDPFAGLILLGIGIALLILK